jgi:hypothetical protein
LALTGCMNNQEIAAKRCASVANQSTAYDQCTAQELANLAKPQNPPTSTGGGGY